MPPRTEVILVQSGNIFFQLDFFYFFTEWDPVEESKDRSLMLLARKFFFIYSPVVEESAMPSCSILAPQN